MLEKKINKKSSVPLILVILDGWGIGEPSKGNAITLAKTPTIDGVSKKYPFTTLCAHGLCVGLPAKQDGNSEAGHMNIGAGRVVEQDAVRISKSINEGSFFRNSGFVEAVRHVQKNKSNLHLMGMVSNGMSAHSDPDHLTALLAMIHKYGVKSVYLHLFTDGRDSPQFMSLSIIDKLKDQFKNGEKIATVIGRFYAMDRKKKWERTEKSYNALVLGEGNMTDDYQSAITQSYNKGQSDEYIEPYVIKDQKNITPRINHNDSLIFFNLRSDRARQLAKAFVQEDFNKMNPGSFHRKKVIKNLRFVAMTDFGPDLDSILTAFPSPDLKDTLPMVLKDFSQLYLAESEKYAHVTYFFNGGYAGKVDGEEQIMIPSPDVKSYDQYPPMKSKELTEEVLKNLNKNKFNFTAINYAAPDMIAHTGNLQAGIECCQAVDFEIKKIIRSYLKKNGTVIITADHGNVEEMINLKTNEIDTEHSTNPVPFILISKERSKIKLRKNGVLGDIAPTILELLGIDKPATMTGKSLLKNI